MRDLDFWRRLDAGAVTPDELRACATWTISRRATFLGKLLPLTEHVDPELRVAALAALAGVRGVTGVRAIVRRLDDDVPAVREAAIAALRVTARDAPVRYAHALFHPSLDVRRAALRDVPHGAAETCAYLRADPACDDLTATTPWPKQRLALVLDLHAMGRVSAAVLVEHLGWTPPVELRDFLLHEPGRTAEDVERYLEQLRAGDAGAAPGRDALDQIVRAIDEIGGHGKPLEHLVTTLAGNANRKLLRRGVVALRSYLEHAAAPALWGALAALEPLVLVTPALAGARLAAAAAGLVRYGWPIRPPEVRVDAMFARPEIRDDLGIAAAVAGLYRGARLAKLTRALGEHAILDALAAGDAGWAAICRLPQEKPPHELRWLQRLEGTRPERHAALAGIALATFHGKRLEGFIDQLQRKSRAPAFLALVRGDLAADAPQLVTVAAMLASRVDRTGLGELLAALLAPEAGERELRIALIVARALTDKLLASAARLLDDAALRRLVAASDELEALPRDREIALAQVAAERGDPELVRWADGVLRVVAASAPVPLPATRSRRELGTAQRERIATARTEAELEDALADALIAPTTGLVPALAARAAGPSVAACAALLGCADPLDQIAAQLDRFADTTPRFEDALDNAAAALWRTGRELPALVHARLWRWEAHLAELVGWIDAAGGTQRALAAIDALPGRLARLTLWRGVAETVVFARYRDRTRFLREGTEDLAVSAATRVDDVVGRHAARICVALVEGGAVPGPAIRKLILDRTPDADAATREQLARLIRLDGMPTPPRAIEGLPPVGDLLAEIRGSRDLDRLLAWARDPRTSVVQEAVLGLLTLGEAGQLRLAALLDEIAGLAAPVPVLESVALWDAPAAVAIARARAAAADLPPEWQFHLCLALGDHARALAAVRAPDPGWFRRKDWVTLTRAIDARACAIALADAPHHHAYAPAVELLLGEWDEPDAVAALQRFLEVDADRPIDLRRAVARRLAFECGDLRGVPLLVDELIDEGPPSWLDRIPFEGREPIARTLVDAGLVGGHAVCAEKHMWILLDRLHDEVRLDPELFDELAARVLEAADTAAVRQAAAQHAVHRATTDARTLAVAEVFAWGVRRGAELCGRMFRFHLTGAERDLGHTFLDGNRIFVSALPMLRGEPHGKDVVEGLVLHELGHHLYHRGKEEQQLWNQAHAEGLGHLLNLVADEHLERNLRALDPAYGDRLKRLGAYAFQHAPQELRLAHLLASLRGAAAAALIGTPLEVAFDEASVRLRRGAILTELERAGHPLARFARALRMGLGNRHDDPVVAAALDLCGRDLRKLDMRGLYDLTRRLAAMFGGATAVAQVFGGPEGLEFGERDESVFGAGIDDDILQREVERILDPRQRRDKGADRGPPRLQINVSPDEEFDRITNVRRVRGTHAEHGKLATEVSRHAARLRHYLDELGLRWEPARARIAGRALDRSRLRALVTRGDPKILVARTPVRRTDLFLGTIVDCSGSMQAGRNIERARKFAVLIAEAVRPLPGVEARFFGFTDSTIYDAGDARDCGVTGLHADGGNNDAAALYHAASVALASRKRARVLVMISDGLPTECSVTALRGLVTTLTRRKGIVCAQVAVRRLEEECFPHHVLLDDAEIDVAVARFGRMIGDLARRSLA